MGKMGKKESKRGKSKNCPRSTSNTKQIIDETGNILIQKTGPYIEGSKDPLVAPRWDSALKLRIQGKSYPAIAEELGYADASGAYRAIMACLAQSSQESGLEQVRQIEVARLDALLEKLWPGVEEGDTDSIKTYIAVSARRAKLLGLDAPVKMDHGIDPNKPIIIKVIKGVSMDDLG